MIGANVLDMYWQISQLQYANFDQRCALMYVSEFPSINHNHFAPRQRISRNNSWNCLRCFRASAFPDVFILYRQCPSLDGIACGCCYDSQELRGTGALCLFRKPLRSSCPAQSVAFTMQLCATQGCFLNAVICIELTYWNLQRCQCSGSPFNLLSGCVCF